MQAIVPVSLRTGADKLALFARSSSSNGRVCLLDPATAQNVLIKFAKAALSPEQLRTALERMDHTVLTPTIVLQELLALGNELGRGLVAAGGASGGGAAGAGRPCAQQ
eukprot:XP_001702198.1 predicted protein [Chlamydomonas reinhardtii]